jgi:hypothetical protein
MKKFAAAVISRCDTCPPPAAFSDAPRRVFFPVGKRRFWIRRRGKSESAVLQKTSDRRRQPWNCAVGSYFHRGGTF